MENDRILFSLPTEIDKPFLKSHMQKSVRPVGSHQPQELLNPGPTPAHQQAYTPPPDVKTHID